MLAAKIIELDDAQAEIKAIIEAETSAFLNRDVDALCACWAQEPYIRHTTILPYCGVVEVNGIAGLRDHFIAHFRLENTLKIKADAIDRRDWKIVVRGEMAWATFEQFVVSDRAAHMSGVQMHTRILEKVAGSWRLIASSGVLSRLDFYDCPKIHVDGTAKIIRASEYSREAVALNPYLRISVGQLTANSPSNAVRLKNAIQEAQKNIECGKARLPIPLNFGEDTGAEGSLCWVAILDMMIVVLLDDIRHFKTTIQTAGQVYGLSAAQVRVAEEIAKGKDLAVIANTLEVSSNTVRTHVKRMFERVGVNSQKTLMKKLLSAQAPVVGPHY